MPICRSCWMPCGLPTWSILSPPFAASAKRFLPQTYRISHAAASHVKPSSKLFFTKCDIKHSKVLPSAENCTSSSAQGFCLQTLGDLTISKSIRLLRAQGLQELGSIFCSCAEAVLSQQQPSTKEDVSLLPSDLQIILHCMILSFIVAISACIISCMAPMPVDILHDLRKTHLFFKRNHLTSWRSLCSAKKPAPSSLGNCQAEIVPMTMSL